MYLSYTDGGNNVDIDDVSQTRQGNTPPATTNSAQTPSPSCQPLLVIDDNSNTDDSSIITTDVPSNLTSFDVQMTHAQITPVSPTSNIETSNDTPEQQRRRNSSIAKLLGGQPLKNQQYEEITQQILDDQSAQNGINNNDNKTDGEIQRSRSSITRNLLSSAEANNNKSKINTMKQPTSPSYSKDFEYLIRRELDIEHSPSTLCRNSSTPSIFQNLSNARNSLSSNSQSKLKRKRPTPKQMIATPSTNKSSNMPSVSVHGPFELDSSPSALVSPINSTPIHHPHHHQNDLYRFDISQRQHSHQNQRQYSLPVNNSTPYATGYMYPKSNLNSLVYGQYKMQHDHIPTTRCSSSNMSSCNCCRYPPTTELALPTPVSPISVYASSSLSTPPYHTIEMSSRKTKPIYKPPNMYEIPMQRSYSNVSNQSISSSSSSSSSHSVPLKKRLLDAYKNEQHS